MLEKEDDNVQRAFEIRFEFRCSPFKEALIVGNLLAVGHEGFFYLFNLLSNENVQTLGMDGYFSHLYSYDGNFYVTSAGSIYCLDQNGKLIWKNSSLGIDGVFIEKFTDDNIYGSGEWDPPGGWRDFILERRSGRYIKENGG